MEIGQLGQEVISVVNKYIIIVGLRLNNTQPTVVCCAFSYLILAIDGSSINYTLQKT